MRDWQLFLWFVYPFVVGIFSTVFPDIVKFIKEHLLHVFAVLSFALLQSTCCKLSVLFRKTRYSPITWIPSFNRNEKYTWENCGTHILKNTILLVTSRDVLLGHFFVSSVPISPQNLKTIWNFIKLRNTEPQTLMFFFQVYTFLSSDSQILRKNTKITNVAFLSRQQMLNRTKSVTKLAIRTWRGVAFMSTFFNRFLTWTGETQCLQLCYKTLQRNNSGPESW